MMTRAERPEKFPIYSVAALAICAFALGILAYDLPSNAGVGGSAPDLLNRAQATENAHKFEKLLDTVEGKSVESKSVESKPAETPKVEAKVQTNTDPVVEKKTTPATVAKPVAVPVKETTTTAVTTTTTDKPVQAAVAAKKKPQHTAKVGNVKLPVVAKKGKDTWLSIGRKWASAYGHSF